MVLDSLAACSGAACWEKRFNSSIAFIERPEGNILLAKPQTYMNRSGAAVKALIDAFDIGLGQAMIVHDDIDMPFGALKIRPGGGHGGHNGIRSIIEFVGAGDFARLKIGVGRPLRHESVSDYVLSAFSEAEVSGVEKILNLSVEAISTFVEKGVEAAMNKYNSSNVFQKE